LRYLISRLDQTKMARQKHLPNHEAEVQPEEPRPKKPWLSVWKDFLWPES